MMYVEITHYPLRVTCSVTSTGLNLTRDTEADTPSSFLLQLDLSGAHQTMHNFLELFEALVVDHIK